MSAGGVLSAVAALALGSALARTPAPPALEVWSPLPEGVRVDVAEHQGQLAALLLDDGRLRFVLQPLFAEEVVALGAGEGLAPELGWSEGAAEPNPACLPFERLSGVLTQAAAGLPAGTRVGVLAAPPLAPDRDQAPTEARIRAPNGLELAVPLSALAVAVGLQLRVDLDGSGPG